jgi:hypothetical protein
VSGQKRCLRLLTDGSQCIYLDWCPIHGDVDHYEAPTMPEGIMTTEMLERYGRSEDWSEES